MKSQIFQLLEEKYVQYNQFQFIETDPISIPHLFDKKEDIEIAGFLSAIIAWGQRKTIISNAKKIVELMDMQPHDFVMHHHKNELKRFASFKHRTFNASDLSYFISALQHIYKKHNGMEAVFAIHSSDMKQAIFHFREVFFELPYQSRTTKHIANPYKNSAAKRINMYLRWMVRKDSRGVDFGIWKSISPAQLMCPLDVHSGNVARKLGLLTRQQDDWKAVEELTQQLRLFDKADPIKYDFSLFGLGVFEGF